MESTLKKYKLSPRLRKQNKIAWFIMTPMLVYYLIFGLVPVIMGILLAFTDYNGFDAPNWIGISNITKIMKSSEFWDMFWITFSISMITMIIGNVLAFLLALLLTVKIRGGIVYRMIWYIPAIVSLAAISDIFSAFLKPNSTGLFNIILARFGKEPMLWQLSAFWMKFWIIFLMIWKGTGGGMLFFLAALNGVNKELYEAAMIDGANRWQKLTKITLPCVKPMLIFVLITSCIQIFALFEPVQLISDGGPDGATKVLTYEIYNAAYQNFKMGYAAGIAFIVFCVIMVITVINMKVTKFNFGGGV